MTTPRLRQALIKVTSAVLALVIVIGTVVSPAQTVWAAPFVSPASTDPRVLFQSRLAERSRSLGFPIAVHLSNETASRISLPSVSSRVLQTIDRNQDDGMTAFGVWTAENKVLLRWMPEEDWIPTEGYSVFRQVANGQIERLVDGLGSVSPTAAQVQTLQSQIRKSGKDLILYPMEAAAGATNAQPDNLTTPNGLRSFVTDLYNQTKVNDAVRQALQQRNLLGSDRSDLGVERALTTLTRQKPAMSRSAIISGASQFNAKATAAALGRPATQLPTEHGAEQVPVVSNRLMQAVPQEVSALNQSASAVNSPIANVNPALLNLSPEDPVENLMANRRSAKTLANSNYQAALASGLAYIDDQLPAPPKGAAIKYWVVATAKSQGTPMLVLPQITVECGTEQLISAPANLAGYGLDAASFLRWQQPTDEFSRSLLAGYMVERSDDGQNFQLVNPEGPIVISYRQDAEGNVYEPEHFFTDSQVQNRSKAYYYRVYAVDVFGRETARSTAIDLTVVKTTAPPEPILSKPVLITPEKPSATGALGAVASRTYGPGDWLQLKERQLISEQQYQALSRLGTISEELLRTNLKLTNLGIDNLRQADGDALREPLQLLMGMGSQEGELEESARRSRVEAKADELRQSGQAGIIINFTQSLEPYGFNGVKKPATASTGSPKMQLARDLKEYRIYRSVAEGSQPYVLPPQLITTISANDPKHMVSIPPITTPAITGGRLGASAQQPEPSGEIVYVDTGVQEGHYYAYWVTAADSWGNESAMQSEPQIVGYASKAVPKQPQNLRATFQVDEAIERINEEKVAGFSAQAKQAADIDLRAALPTIPPASQRVLDIAQSFEDFYAIDVVGADELHADGSVTVRWIPDINTNPLGYEVWRAHDPAADPAAEAARDGFTVSAMMRMRWTLLEASAADAAARPQDAAVAGDELASVITGTQITDKLPLPASGTYYYLIRRVYPEPPEPTYSAFVPGGEVTLTWDEDPNPQITGYRVYRRDVDPQAQISAANAGAEIASKWVMVAQLVRDHRYVDLLAQSRAHYYQYKVRAVTIWGVESPDSLPCQPVRIGSTIPPEVPTLLSPVSGPGSVMIRWQPVDEASRYIIHRSRVPEVGPQQLASVMGTMSTLRMTVPSISGINQPAQAQSVIDRIAAMNTDQRTELWGKVRDRYGMLALAPYYKLSYQDASTVQWTQVGEVSATEGSVLTFTDTTASYPGSYLYAVEAINGQDLLSSGLSKPVTVGPQKSVGPDAPSQVTVTPMVGGGLKVTWPAYTIQAQQAVSTPDAATNAEVVPRGYLVYRAVQESGPYHQCSELLTTNAYLDATVQDGQQYWYRVVILDEAGLLSAASRPVFGQRPATTGTPIRPPAVLTPKPIGFLPDSDFISAPTIVKRWAISLTSGTHDPSVYLLRALPVVPLPPIKLTKPLPPSGVTAQASGTSVTVSWSASLGASGYTIYGYKTEQPEVVLGTVSADQTSLVASGLSPKTTYFIYVVANSKTGDSLPSEVVKVTTSTTVPIVNSPTKLTAVANGSDQVNLAWTGCVGVDGYRVYAYKTEQPEQLMATVGATVTAYTVKGLQAGTDYFFYVTGYKGKVETPPTNVAKATTQASAVAPQLPSKLRVGGYTIRNLTTMPATTAYAKGETIGQLEIPGIPSIPVRVTIQQLSGDQLAQGRVLLTDTYEQPVSAGGTRLRLTDLQLSPGLNNSLAQVSGLLLSPGLAVPGYRGIPLSADTLTPSGTITIPNLLAIWTGEEELADLQSVAIDLVGQSLVSQRSKLMTKLGQITMDTGYIEMRGQQTTIDFAGRLTGSFTGSGRLALAVPKGLDILANAVQLSYQQGVINENASSISGKVILPFIAKESSSTVVGPGPQQEAAQNPLAELTWGAIQSQSSRFTNSPERFNFSALAERGKDMASQSGSQQQGTVTRMSAADADMVNQSLSYMLQGMGNRSAASLSTNPSAVMRSATTTSQTSQSGFQLVGNRTVTTITEREYASIPLTISRWNGQGLHVDMAGPLSEFEIDEQLGKQELSVHSGGSDAGSGSGNDLVRMEAERVAVNLPVRSLGDNPERVSVGSTSDPGFAILQGTMYLPPSVVSVPEGESATEASGATRFGLPIDSAVRYGRNGFWGRLDTETDAGMNIAVQLNKTQGEAGSDYVAATCTSAAVEMLNNRVRATLKGTLVVPQAQKQFRYAGHNDPQGGWMFALANEDGAWIAGASQDPGLSVVFSGGRLEGRTVLLNGTMNAVNMTPDGQEELRIDDLKFVGLAVYIGQIRPQPPQAGEELQPAVYEGLATQPTPAALQGDTITATGVALTVTTDSTGQKVFNWVARAAVALATNLPSTEGCGLKVGADLNLNEEKYSINFLYTHEDFMTISAVLFLDARSKEFAGSGTFWFASTGADKKAPQQRGGEVKVRVGKFKDGPQQGETFWMAKVGYGESGKKWKCKGCGFVYHSVDEPRVCVMTKGEGEDAKPCGGKTFEDPTAQEQSDMTEQEKQEQNQKEFANRGFTIGPLSIKSLTGLVGYNMKPPIGKNGTFEIPPEFGSMTGAGDVDDNKDAFFTWPTKADGNVFFVATAVMTVEYGGQELFTLDPVHLVVASGPAVEIEAKVLRGSTFLAYAKMGYYHQDRRFFMDTRLGFMQFGPYQVEGLGLGLDISPKRQAIYLSYPEILHVILPPSPYPWTFGGGLGFERDGSRYTFMTKAMFGLDTGEKKLADWFYLRAYVTLTGGLIVSLEFVDGKIQSIDDIDFALQVWLEICLKAGVIVNGKKYEVIKAGAELFGEFARRNAVWEVTGRCTLFYAVDLIFWEKSGSIMWEISESYAG